MVRKIAIKSNKIFSLNFFFEIVLQLKLYTRPDTLLEPPRLHFAPPAGAINDIAKMSNGDENQYKNVQ